MGNPGQDRRQGAKTFYIEDQRVVLCWFKCSSGVFIGVFITGFVRKKEGLKLFFGKKGAKTFSTKKGDEDFFSAKIRGAKAFLRPKK